MTEQQESQAMAPQSQPAPATRKPSRTGSALGIIAIVVAVGLAGGLYLHGHQTAMAQKNEIAALKSQLNQAIGKLDNRESQAQLDKLSQGQQQLQQDLQNMQQRVLDLNDRQPNDWLLAEAEYLVRIAGRKLWLEHDLLSAITMLANADDRLKALNDPSLLTLRQSLAEDLSKLKAMPRIDREGLTLKLAALADQIDLLPLSAVTMPQAKEQEDKDVSTNMDDWQSNLKKNWQNFTENFVTVRRRDGAVEALLAPQQEIYLRENLKTKLLQAQLAVYREQQALYQDSLDKASRWVEQYFEENNSATRFMKTELEKLRDEQIQVSYPEQFKSQTLLEQSLNDRLQRIMAER